MKLSRTPVLFLLAIALIAPSVAWAQDPVVFSDPALEAVVREALGIPTDPIMPVDMLNLTSLDAQGRGIVNLTGLEYAANLTYLAIWANQIADLSPLAGLTQLTALDMDRNMVTDLAPLAGLTSLTFICAWENPFSDLTPLAGLTNLERLDIERNQITDLSPLAGLTNLKRLALSRNPISDISPLAGLTELRELWLGDIAIADISPIFGLTNLTTLDLRGNGNVTDFSLVTNLPNLVVLLLAKNQISDLGSLASLTSLSWLDLRANQITDLTPLSGLTNLSHLDLMENQIADLTPLSGMVNLSTLMLARNQISDITAITNITGNLTTLELADNQVGNISPLAGMTNLQILGLARNQISDITALAGLTNLRSLHLNRSQISNISALSGMVNLSTLTLPYNQISDISALVSLTNLTQLDLQYNPLNADACTTHIPELFANNPGITILQTACLDPGSLLVNGGFESGAMAPWKTGTTPPAVITAGVVHELVGAAVPEAPIEGNSCLHVMVSNTNGNWWLTGVIYDGLVFQAGKRYTLSAFLKCKEGTLQINFTPQLTIDPWTGYGERQFTMTDEWAEYSVTTPVFVSNVSPAQITFHVGFAPGEFWMDNVRLIEEDAPPGVVCFADQNLKQAIINALAGIAIYTTDPTETQMAALTQVYANNKGIADLTGIEHAVNLAVLHLNDNQVSNLGPLAGLTSLTDLRVSRNQFSDLSCLSGLTNLTRLYLNGNHISDLSPLSGLINLGRLELATNQITNVSPLSGLTNLTILALQSNQISDVGPLSGLTGLTDLRLVSNQITDVSTLSGLTNLTILRLQTNQISDVSPLSGLTNLTDLQFASNQVNDLGPLSSLINLTILTAGSNQISDIGVLAGLTKLTDLRLPANPISDLSPLVALTTLKTLVVTGCPLSWESYCQWLAVIQSNNPGLTNLQVDPNPYNCDCPPAPTLEGSAVTVVPTDNTTGETPVALTFEQVIDEGGTTLVTSTSGPEPEPGFQLGDPPTYYGISTTASYDGWIDLCVSYAGVSFSGPPEALRLMHYESSQWVDCTTAVYTETQTICGLVSSLSPFTVVQDTAAPVFQSLAAAPNVLWPPSHKMIPITVAWAVTDNFDPAPIVALKTVTMNEGDETNTYDPAFDTTVGDGHTTNDIQVDENGNIFLRAERAGTGAGRTYTLVYQATDFTGNTGTATVIVTVPHEAP